MAVSEWKSLFSHVLNAEAYKQAKYLPAGCWLDIKMIQTLEGGSAECFYGKNCKEAFILQANCKNIDRVWSSNLFLVPSLSTTLPSTEYRTEWSKDFELFVVQKRSSKKRAVDNNSLAFDHFNWSYGSNTNCEIRQGSVLEASSDAVDSAVEVFPSNNDVAMSWADIVEEEQGEEAPSDTQQTSEEELTPAQQFSIYEKAFWEHLWSSPEEYANPQGIAHDELYEAPPGEFYALSFNGQPQHFISTTPPAVSLWAVASKELVHWQHGFSDKSCKTHDTSPFSLKSILSSQACKTLTPILYDGPGNILKENKGTALQDAVTGYASRTFLPIGDITFLEQDPENPHTFHIPSHNHWSSLTLPTSYTTPSYIFDETDLGHKPSPFPYGPSHVKEIAGRSKLRDMELCYEHAEAEQPSTATNTATSSSSSASCSSSTVTSPPSSPPTPSSPTPAAATLEFDPTPLSQEEASRMIAQIDADIAYFYDGEKQKQHEPVVEKASGSSSSSPPPSTSLSTSAAPAAGSSPSKSPSRGQDREAGSSLIEEAAGLFSPSWSTLGLLATGAVIGAGLLAAWQRVKRR